MGSEHPEDNGNSGFGGENSDEEADVNGDDVADNAGHPNGQSYRYWQ